MNDSRRIPTNLITGFLGVGKTTAIRHLISQKPAGERWSVLVNEFGEVGIDGAILEATGADRLAVREIAGGCFCCSTDSPVEFALIELVRETTPDRILIEPTGLGHPAKVLDALRGPWLRGLIDVRATICLVDAADYANPQTTSAAVFQDQLHMADVVVVNKTDRGDAHRRDALLDHLRGMFPPKSLVMSASHGRLDVSLLDAQTLPDRVPLFPEAHPRRDEASQSEDGSAVRTNAVSLILPGRPIRKESQRDGRAACGWIFSPLDCFRKVGLFELLGGSLDVHRLKGVFNVGNEWLLFNRVAGDLTCGSIPYRRDSRLEIILDQPAFDWAEFERLLLDALKGR